MAIRPVGGYEATGRAADRTAVEATGLGKRHRRRWALRDCTFRLPAGRICALVGPAGAGKTTLLSLASGLVRPTEGTVRIGGANGSGPAGRAKVAWVAQGGPLSPRLTVAETLRLGRELAPGHWSERRAEQIVRAGRLPPNARVGALCAGRGAHLALTLALARQPELLLLDDLPAHADPLVRHQVAALLLAQAAEYGTTVVLTSPPLAELDGLCDHLLVLAGGRIRLAGAAEDAVGAHALVMGERRGEGLPPRIAAHPVVDAQLTGRHFTALIRPEGAIAPGPWEVAEPSVEELLLAYLRAPDVPAPNAPGGEPAAPRPRRLLGGTRGHRPGIPGMPRNAAPGRPGPPGGAPRIGHDQHSGKGAAA
ncbi:ATP-binding cassette domain-containing protein [Streptomyces sp. NPDC050355]|uniref:ATP-binding cassette domain-containing protein n=1 Tax=Streptomyces sp. NPDC050355 TaxID=3365609 RepID=UPI0037BD1D67